MRTVLRGQKSQKIWRPARYHVAGTFHTKSSKTSSKNYSLSFSAAEQADEEPAIEMNGNEVSRWHRAPLCEDRPLEKEIRYELASLYPVIVSPESKSRSKAAKHS